MKTIDWPATLLESADYSQVVGVAFLEGPAVAETGEVYFSDIINNRILKWQPGNRFPEIFRQPSGRANGLLFDPQGRLVVCEGNEFGPNDGQRRITRTDLKTGQLEILTDQYEGRRYNSPNDLAIRSNGQIFFTDPCYGDRSTMELDHESVYRIDPDGKISRILTQPEVQRPNGIALSPDEKTLYVVDSCPVPGGARKILACDLDNQGEVGSPHVLFDFAPGRGGDGMCVDQLGHLYVAAGILRPRGAHETKDIPAGIYIINPTGELLGRIPVPEDVITNCTFGGEDLRTLYITAGKSLFAVRTRHAGWVVHRCQLHMQR
ncbi:MAG: hypothetical protein KatS3mg113_0884 [Planctomycetaceae bacterium]|nr:MAG: hypothetical protein KatS3mg113_0884 [Planctomycetaceae bacterium]